MIPAVLAEPDILGQTVEVSGTFTVRLVVADGIGDILQALESVGSLVHEFLDLGRSLRLEFRTDVNQNERGAVDVVLTDRDQADAATHGRTDEYRTVTQLRHDRLQILHHDVLAVLAVRGPVGITVAPGIQRNRRCSRQPRASLRRPSTRDGSARRRAGE